MADELKDQRVVTMMSPSELEAIDDWMFRNRIRSRGEAIRRLCQLGMTLDRKLKFVLRAVIDSSDKTSKTLQSLDETISQSGAPLPVVNATLGAHVEVASAMANIIFSVGSTALEAFPMKIGGQLDESFSFARDMEVKLSEMRPENKDDFDELVRMLNAISKMTSPA